MSIVKHLSIALLCNLVCHVASRILNNFIFPWLNAEEKQSHSCGAHHGYKGEESCYHSTHDSSLQYYLFIMLNSVMLSVLAMGHYDTEDTVVTYLKLPFTICRNMIKGNLYVYVSIYSKASIAYTRLEYYMYLDRVCLEFETDNETSVNKQIGRCLMQWPQCSITRCVVNEDEDHRIKS